MNVKPGDLAIQIKSVASNEGRIVKVVRWIGEIDFFYEPLIDCWLCEVSNAPPNEFFPAGHYGIPDSWLRPISGLPLQEDEQTDIKEPA